MSKVRWFVLVLALCVFCYAGYRLYRIPVIYHLFGVQGSGSGIQFTSAVIYEESDDRRERRACGGIRASACGGYGSTKAGK